MMTDTSTGNQSFIFKLRYSKQTKLLNCNFYLLKGDIYLIKREENSKYNYLVEEADPSAVSERIDV